MALLNKQQCRKSVKLRQETVPYPELGGEILVEELTGDEWSQLEKGGRLYNMRLLMAGARDGKGGMLFDPIDANWLATWPVHMLERGAEAVLRCCGLLAGQPDEMVKNSPTPTPPPSGGSPSPSDAPGASS